MRKKVSLGFVLFGCLAMFAFMAMPACSDDDSSAAASSSVAASSTSTSASSVATSSTSGASSSVAASSSSATADFIALTFDGTAYNFTAGPTDTVSGADSMATGFYVTDGNTMILASATADLFSTLRGGSVNGAAIQWNSVDSTATPTISYIEINLGGQSWSTDDVGGSFALTITAYGAVGGTISGTFSGTAVQVLKSRVTGPSSSSAASSSAPATKSFTGSFSVTRHANLTAG